MTDLAALIAHEWVEVGNRRWCLTCDAFQSRKSIARSWQPIAPLPCPQDTPHARQRKTVLVFEGEELTLSKV